MCVEPSPASVMTSIHACLSLTFDETAFRPLNPSGHQHATGIVASPSQRCTRLDGESCATRNVRRTCGRDDANEIVEIHMRVLVRDDAFGLFRTNRRAQRFDVAHRTGQQMRARFLRRPVRYLNVCWTRVYVFKSRSTVCLDTSATYLVISGYLTRTLS